jgi:hypothetical protein
MRFLIVIVFFALTLTSAEATTLLPPRCSETASADGKFVFVMFPNITLERERKTLNDSARSAAHAIRHPWPQSGMYRNDGSIVPLWTVDWFSYKVDVLSDGEHVVRYTAYGLTREGESALAFYRNGELLRSYERTDLSLIGRKGWLDESHLDETTSTLAVETTTYEWYTFDVRTGEMTSRFRPLIYAIRGLIAIGLLLPAWFLWRRRRRRRGSVSLAA